jgi:NTE family protein
MFSNKIENVLVLQGGGSLGAFGCGVFKALTNNSIKIDIVA